MTGREPTGLFLVDKPIGPTSHDIVQQLRRWTGVRRVGHGGTLDPMATGLLPVFVGRATRLIEYIGEHRKRYTATIRLGVRTDTDDAEGDAIAERPVPDLRTEDLEHVLDSFRGVIQQVPPAFSAVKVGGVTAHRAARLGEQLELAPREVRIHELTLADWQSPDLRVEMTVSTGTYVRAIARDLGEALGCGAHIVEMRRTGIGPVDAEEAHTPAELEAAFRGARRDPRNGPTPDDPEASDGGTAGWALATPLVRLFEHWPRVIPTMSQRGRILNGQAVPVTVAGKAKYALAVDRLGAPIAVLSPEGGWPERWRPVKVLITRG